MMGKKKYRLLSRMNVRIAPSVDAEKVSVLSADTVVDVLKIENDWLCLTNGTFILYGGGKYAERSDT